MKKTISVLSLVLVLCMFVLMALGSGSSKSENKGAEGATTVTDGKETSTEAKKDTKATEKEKDSYEVGEAEAIVYKDSIGTYWVQISVPVTNTGSVNLYLSSGTMDLEDADGHLVESASMVSAYPQVIKPGETGWYYEETTLDKAPDTDLKVIPHVSAKKATVDCIRYSVSDLSIGNETYGGIKITGRVENVTDEDESMPYVVAFLYDADDHFLGQAFTILDELKAGDKMGFSMSTFASNPDFKAENVKRYDVIAYPMKLQF